MSRPDIDELATGPKESAQVLAARLTELRSRGASLLDCIRYVKLNQDCSLGEASGIVINSPAWVDQRDEFLRQQQEAFEEFLAFENDRVESIQQTITPNGTEYVVHLKTSVGPSQGSAEPDTAADSGSVSS
jgi:hypothetical protein